MERDAADRAKEGLIKWGVVVLTFLTLARIVWQEVQTLLHQSGTFTNGG